MAKFPTKEADIYALGQNVKAGLAGAAFANAPKDATAIQTRLDAYLLKKNASSVTEVAYHQAINEKNEALGELAGDLKIDLHWAEDNVSPEELGELGWGPPDEPTPTPAPDQPRNLKIVSESNNRLEINWESPLEGGHADFYEMYRWQEGGGGPKLEAAFPSNQTHVFLENQPTGMGLFYYVISKNKAGESTPSNTVRAVL